jgi:hypothetical protein
MALEPDIVAQFVWTLTSGCPPDQILEQISRAVRVALPRPDSGDEDAASRVRTLAACTGRAGNAGNLISVGTWFDPGSFSERQLRDALTDRDFLARSDGTAALLVTAAAIRTMAAQALRTTDLPDRLSLKDFRVNLTTDKIVTTIQGVLDVPDLVDVLDVSFDSTITDRLTLRPAGSVPPLQAHSSRTTHAPAKALKLVGAAIGSLINALFGQLIVFTPTDEILDAQVGRRETVGEGLAAQWPGEVMTRIAQPNFPGKVTFSWRDLSVDATGVLTLGTYALVPREPRVSVVGPTTVEIRRPNKRATVAYSALTADLRGTDDRPVRFRWRLDDDPLDRRKSQSVTFDSTFMTIGSSSSHDVQVTATDADGLSANRTQPVGIQVTGPPGADEP